MPTLNECWSRIVARKERFYVYMLSRPDGTPFYVGCGRGGRIKTHEAQARTSVRSRKVSIIRKIIRAGGVVDYSVDLFSDDWSLVLQRECDLIALYGRLDLGTGTLANVTSGGEGTAGKGPEELRKLAARSRLRWQSVERRVEFGRQMRRLWATPEYRARWQDSIAAKRAAGFFSEKRSAASRARWQGAGNRDRYVEKLKAAWAVPEVRSRRSAIIRHAMKESEKHQTRLALMRRPPREAVSPEERKRRKCKRMAELFNDPVFRERHRRATKAASLKAAQNPGEREAKSRRSRVSWADPAIRTKRSQAQKKRWSDPALRRAQAEKISAAARRRRR